MQYKVQQRLIAQALANQARYLKLKKSSIPEAGVGVFARASIPANTAVTLYSGVRVSAAAVAVHQPQSKYLLAVSPHVTIDAEVCEMHPRFDTYCTKQDINYGRYMNDHTTTHNVKWTTSSFGPFYINNEQYYTVLLRTITKIEKNSELFISYGPNYWLCR